MSETLSHRAPEPVGPYCHARRAGGLLFLAGIGPRVRGVDGVPGVTLNHAGEVVSYDFERQCRQVFENIRLVLEDAGSSWEKIVDVTVFLTDMKRDFASFNRYYGEAFATNKPSRTTVEVNCLPTPIAVELKVIATI